MMRPPDTLVLLIVLSLAGLSGCGASRTSVASPKVPPPSTGEPGAAAAREPSPAGASAGAAAARTSPAPAERFARPGFAVFDVDGRLWVFREGDAALEAFRTAGEPAAHVIRVKAGPLGMTVKAPDAATIDAYLQAL